MSTFFSTILGTILNNSDILLSVLRHLFPVMTNNLHGGLFQFMTPLNLHSRNILVINDFEYFEVGFDFRSMGSPASFHMLVRPSL